jgi:hypothetical protein
MLRKIIGFYLNVMGFTSENITSKMGKGDVLNTISSPTNNFPTTQVTSTQQNTRLENEDAINEVAGILRNLGDLLEISMQLQNNSNQQRN